MSPVTKAKTSVFDDFTDSYEAACDRGLALSGEDREYFARRRVDHTRRLCSSFSVTTIVDFGCGLGHSTPHLLEAFPRARIVGVDTSKAAIEAAGRRYGSDQIQFTTDGRALEQDVADLAYSNGTFHHIEPIDREAEVRKIRQWLAPGGLFVLWENNPWNPGTRLVMKRIPFDRDAQPLSYLEARTLLTRCGFRVVAASFHFYFPAWLKALRRFEPALERLPLGAQYCLLAQRDPAADWHARQSGL